MASLVECHASYKYPQRPSAFQWEGRRLEVSVVRAAWRSPEGEHFRVATTEAREFELVYDTAQDEWHIRPQ